MHELPTAIEPQYPLKDREKSVFMAEQAFLIAVAGSLPQCETGQLDQLYSHLQDISSTAMAQQVFMAYGLPDSICHSLSSIAPVYGVTQNTINTNKRVVLQSLYLQNDTVLDGLDEKTKNELKSRYGPTSEVAKTGKQDQVLERAERNIAYYNDRKYIQFHEEEVLDLMKDLYGEEKLDMFMRYYRLSLYSNSESFERSGNIAVMVPTNIFRLHLNDSLEAGRSVTEYIYGADIGTHLWTNNKGKQIAGYRRIGTRFESVLKRYYHQMQIHEALLLVGQKILLPLEYELIMKTTQAFLADQDIQVGIEQFNKKYGTRHDWASVRRIGRKLLDLFEGNTVLRAQRKEWVREVLTNPIGTDQIVKLLADTVYNFHVASMTLDQISDEVGLNRSYTGELKRMLDKLISGFLYQNPATQKRGALTSEMINSCFENEKFIELIKEIIQKMPESSSLITLSFEYENNYRIRPQEIFALRMLVTNIAQELQKSRLVNNGQ